MKARLLALTICCVIAPFSMAGQALAACASPSGVAGSFTYNGTNAMIWCDGTNWLTLGSGNGTINALTGDVTASGMGSVVATIANKAVTYAKIQDTSAAGVLLGRGAGSGAGVVQELTLGPGLSLTGTTLSATGSLSGSGTTNYLAKFTGASAIGNSQIFDNGTNVGIGTTSPSEKMEVNGNIKAAQFCNSSGVCVDPTTLTPSGAVPSGAVMYFARTTCPSTWMEADGSAISRSTYAQLFSAIGTLYGSGNGSTTFNLPDLRGEFVRGWDHGRGVDSGRTFASSQSGSSVVYPGYVAGSAERSIATGYADRWGFIGSTYDNGFSVNISPGATSNGVTFPATGSNSAAISYITADEDEHEVTTWNMASGSRPRNVALLPCVKQ